MKIALIDERLSERVERNLRKYGFLPIRLPRFSGLGEDVASHPDMLTFKCEDTLLSFCDYAADATPVFSDIREYCADIKLAFANESPRVAYPYDAIFNALLIGKYIFCKKDTVSPTLLRIAEEHGFTPLHVKQGYPACTALALDDKHAITADEGMARAMRKVGIEVTLIRQGHIALPHREYGFIGGAAGVLNDTVYFIGDIRMHPDFDIIKAAIESANMKYLSLDESELFDGGRIIFL